MKMTEPIFYPPEDETLYFYCPHCRTHVRLVEATTHKHVHDTAETRREREVAIKKALLASLKKHGVKIV